MARFDSKLLDANDLFPEMDLSLTTGEMIKVPEGLGDGYGVLFSYRGYW